MQTLKIALLPKGLSAARQPHGPTQGPIRNTNESSSLYEDEGI